MATVRRSNPEAFKVLAARLGALDGVTGKTGWLGSQKYENGMPVAAVAALQENGATIAHPGGTPYRIGADGRAVFVSKAQGAGLPVTKAHQIVIPPRPFFRPTIAAKQQEWLNQLGAGAKAVLAGKASPIGVMDIVTARAAADVAKTISEIFSPPLKPATIAARRRQMANKKIIGNLTKPLVFRGILVDALTNKVEKE